MTAPVDYLIVEVRSRGLSRVPGSADESASPDGIPLTDTYVIHVGIPGLVAEPMVNNHVVAVPEPLFPDSLHNTVSGGIDGISDAACEIHPLMLCGPP